MSDPDRREGEARRLPSGQLGVELEALIDQFQEVSVDTLGGGSGDRSPDPLQCCVCQERSVNPVRLPCQHIFCFLCIKGEIARRGRCALCRGEIPTDFLNKPAVVNKEEIKSKLEQAEDTSQWFYEARSGEAWWMFEQRTSTEIERAFSNDEKNCRVRIAGFPYVIDFERMVQYREDIPTRQRRIKRDTASSSVVKGVAGIYVGRGGGGGGGGEEEEEEGQRGRREGSRELDGIDPGLRSRANVIGEEREEEEEEEEEEGQRGPVEALTTGEEGSLVVGVPPSLLTRDEHTSDDESGGRRGRTSNGSGHLVTGWK